jgi:hypothetical protein
MVIKPQLPTAVVAVKYVTCAARYLPWGLDPFVRSDNLTFLRELVSFNHTHYYRCCSQLLPFNTRQDQPIHFTGLHILWLTATT